jgi:PAS domain-containing protein
MIVGDKFVWLHFPKSGGHAVDQALKSVIRALPDVSFDAADSRGWHDSLGERQQRDPRLRLSDRTVICGFRRLPYWMLSRVHYEASRPPYLAATRAMLCRGEFFHQNGQVGKADDDARHYGDSRVERWIRTEHLAEDFERHFSDILGSHLARAALRKVRRIVNGTRLNYIRSLDFYFTPTELASLYAANPRWAAMERALYGDVLRLSDVEAERYYFLDRELRFVAASPVALRTWGKSPEEVIGKPLLTVFPLADDTEPYRAHVRALRTMRPIQFDAVSPTLARPVHVNLDPTPAGLKVSFEIVAH